MLINIHCFGQIRSLTKERIVELDVPEGISISLALQKFSDTFGEKMDHLLYTNGKLRDFYSIQVDKQHIKSERFDDFILENGQTIAIIPFIAGG